MPSFLVLLVGAGAALTGPGSEPNGTGDAARRGSGCAALQLNPRRRPSTPPHRSSSRPLSPPRPPPALRPPLVPTLPGLGVSRLRARGRRCARPSASATLSSTGLCQRGDPPGLPLGWWAGSSSRLHPSAPAILFFLGGGAFPLFCDRKDAKCLPSRWRGGVLSGSIHKPRPFFF